MSAARGGERVSVLALNKTQAAQMLGVSVDFFDEHIVGELRVVRRGRRALYSQRELERWLDDAAEGPDGGLRRPGST
jgi:hypothetical protein